MRSRVWDPGGVGFDSIWPAFHACVKFVCAPGRAGASTATNGGKFESNNLMYGIKSMIIVENNEYIIHTWFFQDIIYLLVESSTEKQFHLSSSLRQRT